MSSSFAAAANRFLSYVAGPSSQPSEQPIPMTDEVEGEANDLAAENYISPSNRSRGSTRRQRRTEQEGSVTSHHFQSHAMQRSNGSERTERQQQLLRPRAGDKSGTVGTPLQHPSFRVSSRGLNGAVRPRNDFSSQNGTTPRNSMAQNRIASNGSEPAAKRRKTIAAEGDGFEQEPIVKTRARNITTQKANIKTRPVRDSVNLHNIRRQHYERTLGIAADGTEDDTTTASGVARHRTDGTLITLLQSSDQEPRDSSRSSPDPLAGANDSGPDGPYKSVALIRNHSSTENRRRPRCEQEPVAAGTGFQLSRVWYGEGYKDTGPGLELVPQRNGDSFEFVKNGSHIHLVLRKEQIPHLIFGEDDLMVTARALNDNSAVGEMSMRFAAGKDWTAFLMEVAPRLKEPPRLYKKDSSSAKRAFDISGFTDSLNRGEHSSDVSEGFVMLPRNKKTRYGRVSGPGESINHYKSGSTGQSTRFGRTATESVSFVRRSTRTTRNNSTNFTNLTDDGTYDSTTPAPEVHKYSVEHGLPNKWKHHLTYPKIGKNRATVYWDDLYKLDEGELLNDNLINFHIRFQEDKLSKENPKVAKRVYWFNTYFFTTLVSGRRTVKDINYDAVKKWTRNIDIFGYDYIVVPIVEKFHWYVAVICNVSHINQTTTQDGQLVSSETAEQESVAQESTAVQNTTELVEDVGKTLDFSDMLAGSSGSRNQRLQASPMDMADDAAAGASVHQEAAPRGTERQLNILKDEPKQDSDMIESSSSSPISLLGAKRTGAGTGIPLIEPQSRSIDDIFAVVSESGTEDTTRAPSRPSTTESRHRHQIQSLLQELGNHVESTKEEAAQSINDFDEAEHAVPKEDEIELIAQSSQHTNKLQVRPKSPVRRKGRNLAPTRRFQPHKPAVITLDSLGHSHSATIRALKQYLVAEAEDKRGGMEVDPKEIQGVTGVGIPNQDNFSDCGLYLLGYVEKFAANPEWLVKNLLQKTLDPDKDWPELNANAMRASLRDLLCQQYADQREETGTSKAARKAADDTYPPARTTLASETAESTVQAQGEQDDERLIERSALAADMDEGSRLVSSQIAVRGRLDEKSVASSSDNQDAGMGKDDVYHLLDDSLCSPQQIEVHIPKYAELEDARAVPETPDASPYPQPAPESSRGFSQGRQPPTPVRPKSRGKDVVRASRAVGAISGEPIVLDDD